MMGYSPPEFSAARYIFATMAILLGVGGLAWLVATDQSLAWRALWGAVLGLVVFVVFPISIRWVNARQKEWIITQAKFSQKE